MLVLLIFMVMAAATLSVLIMVVMLVLLIFMVMAAATLPVFVVVMVVMLVRILLMKVLHHLMHHLVESIGALDGDQYILAVQLIQRSGDDGCLVIVLPDQCHTLLELLRTHLIGSAQDNGSGKLDLIDEKLAEILDIHLCLGCIDNRYRTVNLYSQLSCHILHCLQHIGELTDTGGLDQNSLRGVGLNDFLQRGSEVTYQGTADTPGVHLLNLNAGFLQKTAVDTNLTELVLDQHGLAAIECFLQKFLNQSGFSCSQKAGKHIYLCHFHSPFCGLRLLHHLSFSPISRGLSRIPIGKFL